MKIVISTIEGKTLRVVALSLILSATQAFAAEQTQTFSAAAMSAATAIDAIGVNVHMDYLDTAYGNSARAIDSLKYLGLKNVRDVTPATFLGSVNYLGSEGFKFTFLTRSENVAELQTTVLKTLEELEGRYPGVVNTMEGLNEANFWPVNYKGQSGYAAAVAVQRDLFAMVKASPKLNKARVANLTLGGVGYDEYAKLGDLSQYADVGNTHIYFNDGVPSSTWKFGFELGASATPGLKRMIVSETGYSTAINDSTGVDQNAQAVYTLYLVLNALQTGVETVFLYQLVDHFDDPSQSNRELGFGLFKNDWTAKQAAVVLHNLTTTLSDGGAIASGASLGTALVYRIVSTTGGVQSLVLQEGDGTRDVLLWKEQSVWDAAGNRALPGTTLPIAVTFEDFTGAVTAVDLTNGTRKVLSASVAAPRLELALGPTPLLLELKMAKMPKPVDLLQVN